ncbi:MAG: helix-turn-helix transcriptional regulator [Nitrospinae bacterium]|nr:helix-turn-helix transcriptional regulator [Nitrospinota bacterium]
MAQSYEPVIVCRLSELLRRRGWSQRKLARRTGLSRTTIAWLCADHWWHGTNAMSLRVLATLCQALHVSPGTLLRLTYRPRLSAASRSSARASLARLARSPSPAAG